MQFNSFEEFWAALDRLDLDIRRLQESQRKLSEQLAQRAQRQVAQTQMRSGRGEEDRLAASLAALVLKISRLAATVRRNERRLKKRRRS